MPRNERISGVRRPPDKGLGALIIQATFNYQSDRLYAAIVLSSSLSISIFMIVVLLERRFVRY